MRRLWVSAIIPALVALGCNGGGGGGNGGGFSTTAPSTSSNPITPITTGSTGGVVVVKPGTGPVTSGTKPGGTGPVTSTTGPVTKTPAVLTVTPKTAAQGSVVTLAGVNLDQATNVMVGGVPLVNAVVQPTEIKGTLGAHAAGAADVTLTDKATGKTLTYSGLFTYLAPPTTPAPAVTSVTPATAAQGTAITINGTNLDQAAKVTVGGIALTATSSTATTFKGTLGNHAAGAVDIVVTDKQGKTYTFTGKFTYLAPGTTPPAPAVTTVAPASAAQGTDITINGTNLDQVKTVTVGGVALVNPTIAAATIKGTLGIHAAGAVDIVLTDLAGKTYTVTGKFTYLAPTGTTPPTSATITMKPMGSMAKPRGVHSATLLDDGRVLFVGGIDATTKAFVIENEIYDPVTNTFTVTSAAALGGNPGGYMAVVSQGKAIPTPRYGHTATKLNDGRVLIVGGYGSEALDAQQKPVFGELVSSFVFDPKTNKFSGAGQLKTARRNHEAVVLANGWVMVMGGYNATINAGKGGSLQSIEIFDPAQNKWGTLQGSTGKDLLLPRQDAASAGYGGTAVLTGGLAYMPDATGAIKAYLAPGLEIFNPQTAKFVASTAPAVVRYAANMEQLAGSKDLVLVGGVGIVTSGQPAAQVMGIERLDSKTGKWATVGQLTSGRRYPSTAVSHDELLIAGGTDVDAQGKITVAAEAIFFDGANNQMTTAKLATARTSCTVTALKTGYLIAGGFNAPVASTIGLDGQTVGTAELAQVTTSATTTPPTPGPLTITDVTPKEAAPGSKITIKGTNLDQFVDVQVGGVLLTNVTMTPTEITGTLGQHADGVVNVTIKDKNGAIHSKQGAFTYKAVTGGGGTGTPTTTMKFTKITPDNGGAGVQVTVTGTGFKNITKVTLGGVDVSASAAYNATTLVFVTGTHAVGPADLVITSSSEGTLTQTAAYNYTSSAPPAPATMTITSVTPNVGKAGTVVTVKGTNFQNLTSATLGGVPVVGGQYNPATGTLTFQAPAHANGKVDLVIKSSTNGTVTKTDAFTYQ